MKPRQVIQYSTHIRTILMGLLLFLKTMRLKRLQVGQIFMCHMWIPNKLLIYIFVNYLNVHFFETEHPDVVSVFPNQVKKLHTTHSWDFLMLERNGSVHASSAWKRSRFGEDIIIANLDTGN